MKRLYLVGTTTDNKRLVLAKTSGAKFGSFVIPITPKLKRILRDLEEGTAGNARRGKGAEEPAEAEPAMTAAEAAASNTFERMTGLTDRKGAPSRGGSAAPQPAKAAAARGKKAAPAPGPEPEEKPAERRPPINSKLAPAQIQAMLRQGKGPRSVAKAAGAPLEWVQRLMMPILQERMGIVEELKRATYTKTRLGPSIVPVGASIVGHLRDRGVAFPERTATQGWTAYRPDGREWRVKFTFEHRGSNRTAQWEFDPPSRSVVPLNALATQLSWRGRPSDEDGDGSDARPRRAAPARKRAPSRKAAPKRRAAAKRTAKRATKRSPAKRSTTKRAPARRSSAKKKPAARRRA